jgi:hypothetical protein
MSPQVRCLGFGCVMVVRAFEFVHMTSAPGRIRTCARGSGEGCCVALTSGNMLAEILSGRV